MNPCVKHAAEAACGAVIASAYAWLPYVEEPLRIAVGLGGLVLVILQIRLALRAWRRGGSSEP